MKRILLFVLITSVSGGLYAQGQRCATMEYFEKQKNEDAALENRMLNIESEIQDYIANNSANKTQVTSTIPVVFHILYNVNNSSQNISTARILDQLVALNEDFSATNADISNVPAAFQGVIGNAGIAFCLAQQDPSGNPTDGIIRKSTSVSSFNTNDAIKFDAQGGSNAWPRNQYLNIWVSNLSGNLLGYAQFPGGPASTDGVVVLNASIGGPNFPGTISNYAIGRTATHEVGHWLNLRHIWGDSNCGNDLVSDTPTQQTSNSGCPSFPHVTCSNGPNGDMFMNYMDYVYDGCMVMFSAGQATRMNASLNTTRISLLSSPGCENPVVAAPVAAFQANNTTICKFDQVAFTDLSTNSPTSWSWTFTGGTPANSSQQNPVITYNSAGVYPVSLTVSNAGGNDTQTLTGYITVNGLPQFTVQTTNGQTQFCAGSSLTLEVNTTNNNLSYQWKRYGVNISGANGPTYVVTKTGNYKVEVTKSNGCSKLSGPNKLTKLPYPSLSLTAAGSTDICAGDSVQLQATFDPGYIYTWKKYGNIIGGATSDTYWATSAGKYKVIVENTNGCLRSSPKVNVNVVCRTANDELDTQFTLSPNPVNNGMIKLNVGSRKTDGSRVYIFGTDGRACFEQSLSQESGNEMELDITELRSGIYLLLFESPEERISQKFIVQ